MAETAVQDDLDFVQRSMKLVSLWIGLMVLAGLGLIFYGDLLMQFFT